MLLGLDRHYYPIVIPAGTTITIKAVAVSLTAGTYWAHDDATLTGIYPSFYAHLRARLAAVYGGTWTVSPITPAGYSLRSGVRLAIAPGSGTETIDLSATSPIVKQLLGFASTATGTVAFVAKALDGVRAAYGSWSPWSAFDGRATSKDSMPEAVLAWSSDHAEVAKAIVWRQRRLRLCIYQYVYGATIIGSRSQVADLATQAGVATDDDHNALDNLWRAAGLDNGTVLISHDATTLDLQVASRRWDAAKIATRAAAADLGVVAARNGLASDLYDVRLPYVVIGGDYGL